MPTPTDEQYKEDQRAARQSQYRIYRRINDNRIVPAGHLRAQPTLFFISGLGFSSMRTGGGVWVPEHVIEAKKLKRKVKNRIARLSRRANRR